MAIVRAFAATRFCSQPYRASIESAVGWAKCEGAVPKKNGRSFVLKLRPSVSPLPFPASPGEMYPRFLPKRRKQKKYSVSGHKLNRRVRMAARTPNPCPRHAPGLQCRLQYCLALKRYVSSKPIFLQRPCQRLASAEIAGNQDPGRVYFRWYNPGPEGVSAPLADAGLSSHIVCANPASGSARDDTTVQGPHQCR